MVVILLILFIALLVRGEMGLNGESSGASYTLHFKGSGINNSRPVTIVIIIVNEVDLDRLML